MHGKGLKQWMVHKQILNPYYLQLWWSLISNCQLSAVKPDHLSEWEFRVFNQMGLIFISSVFISTPQWFGHKPCDSTPRMTKRRFVYGEELCFRSGFCWLQLVIGPSGHYIPGPSPELSPTFGFHYPLRWPCYSYVC